MVEGVILVVEFAGLAIDDVGTGHGGLDAFEQGVGVSLGRCAAVVAVEHGGIVGVRTEHGDGLQAL